jgi:restriction system protein
LPYDLARDLESIEQDTALVILDDADVAPLADPPSVVNALSRLPQTTLLMTALEDGLDRSWDPIAGPTTDTTRVPLRGLTNEEGRILLTQAGAIDGPHRDLAGTAEYDGALGQAMGNPRLLLEWAYWHRDERPNSEIATILGPDGQPIPRGDERLGQVEVAASGINDALIAELARRPQLMYELSPRQFEELVAELYERSGFEVELTRASKDGGVDIYAFQRAPFGSFLTIVDCKRHRADRPVQIGLIRQLYGTVMATDASVGVIATTSYFTKGAKTFQAERKHRLGLQDFVSLKDLLKRPSP